MTDLHSVQNDMIRQSLPNTMESTNNVFVTMYRMSSKNNKNKNKNDNENPGELIMDFRTKNEMKEFISKQVQAKVQSQIQQLKNKGYVTLIKDNAHNKNNDENAQNDDGVIKTLIQNQKLQLDIQNKATFKVPFTGDPKKTLPYIFKMKMFLDVSGIQDAGMQFQCIFNSLKWHHRQTFMMDNTDKKLHTVEVLQTWMLKNYPPPISKYEFKISLQTITIKKAEDPCAVVRKVKNKLNKINKAIEIINTGIDKPESHLKPFDDEFIAELYAGIFIRKNNQQKYNNVHELNKRIRNYCLKENPTNIEEWNKIIKKFDAIIPRALCSDPNYQYIPYVTSVEEEDIYVTNRTSGYNKNKHKNHKRKYDEASWTKNTKTFNTGKLNEPSRKRFKGDCIKCGKPNHVASECKSKRHKDGTLLIMTTAKNRNRNIKCYRCHRKGHVRRDCVANWYPRDYKMGALIPDKAPAMRSSKPITNKPFNVYNPSVNPANIRHQKEINDEQQKRNVNNWQMKKQLLNMVKLEDLMKLAADGVAASNSGCPRN